MYKKKERVLRRHIDGGEISLSHVLLFFGLILFGIFSIVIVEGFDVITVTPVNPGAVVNGTNISGPVRENVNFTINITINNSALVAYDNITQVNITLPSSFSFLNGTNNTNATTAGYGITFINTSSVLSWNSTLAAGTSATLISNATLVYFWFMINASTPGAFNITVTTMNVSGFTNSTNISITVNDTTAPSNIAFQGLTPANYSFLAGNETNNASIFVNISAYDNGAIQTIFFQLNNASTLNESNRTTISNFSQEFKLNANVTYNFTGLQEGIYFLNVSVNDTFNNVNTSIIRTFIVDNLAPSANYSLGSDLNGTYLARNFIAVNVTIIETNFNTTNVSLMNATSFINQSNLSVRNITATNSSLYLNFTNLADGVYFVNVSVNDSAGHMNRSLVTRTFVVDTTNPLLTYGTTTDANGSYVGRNFIIVNVTATEVNLNITNVSLYNASSFLNQTNLTLFNSTNPTYINFTNLLDGIYFFNVTANDTAGNRNNSFVTRTVVVDTTNLNVSYVGRTDANGSYVARNFIIVEVNSTDTNFNSTNVTLFNATSSAIVRSNLTYSVADFGSNRTNVALYLNFTALTDGTYFFNVTSNDTAGNRNLTLHTRTITVDTATPVLTLTEGTVTSNSITLSITANDATSGVNGSCTVDRSGASVTGTGASQTVTENNLACSTPHTYVVSCLDRAANGISGNIVVTTLGCDSGSGGSGGGGGGGSAGEKWSNTFIVKDDQFKRGYSRELKERERVSVKINNANHHIGVVSVDDTGKKVTIEIASTPQKVILGVGETKKFEVTNDSYYDIQVKLISIINGKADVLIKSIRELITSAPQQQPALDGQEEPQRAAEEGQQPVSEEGADLPFEKKSKSTLVSIIGALVLAVIIVIVLIVIVQHRKSFR